MWCLEKFRQGYHPLEFAKEPKPKKKVRGYALSPSIAAWFLAIDIECASVQMGSTSSKEEDPKVSESCIRIEPIFSISYPLQTEQLYYSPFFFFAF